MIALEKWSALRRCYCRTLYAPCRLHIWRMACSRPKDYSGSWSNLARRVRYGNVNRKFQPLEMYPLDWCWVAFFPILECTEFSSTGFPGRTFLVLCTLEHRRFLVYGHAETQKTTFTWKLCARSTVTL